LKGRWQLLFFGYTFCPDVCPTTLAQLRELQGKLPQEVRDDLQVVFVSVDPNRATPQQIKQCLGYFNAGFQGPPGTPEHIQK
ncbi:SCO family protein, partial [Pseudomonas aeruginosa]